MMMMGNSLYHKVGNVRKFKSQMRLVFKSLSLISVVIIYACINTVDNPIDVRRLDGGCVEPADPKWLAFFYTLGILWLFLALAIVADEYFVPALDIIAEEWKLSPDVAGATLLAAGGSAPELFTNLSAVVQDSSSTGFGAIVGSAVFNLFFVVGVCAIVCPTPMVLTWWPVCRDSTYYAWVLLWLAVFFRDYNIVYWEALILHFFYWIYILIMAYNVQLQNFFSKFFKKESLLESETKPVGVVKSSDIREGFFQLLTKNKSIFETTGISMITKLNMTCAEAFAKVDKDGNGSIDKDELKQLFHEMGIADVDQAVINCLKEADVNGDGMLDGAEFGKWWISSKERLYADITALFRKIDVDGNGELSAAELKIIIDSLGLSINTEKAIGEMIQSSVNMSSITIEILIKWIENNSEIMTEFNKQASILEETAEGISFYPPSEKTFYTMFWYIVTLPQIASFWLTLVDTRIPGKAKYRYYTFLVCLCWFGLISYFLIQWIEAVGSTAGIPSVLMGLTFLAMGTSVPDMLSAIIVAKSGEADKAVSSSIGSNVFDISVGLAVPWLIYCMIHSDKPDVPVEASSLLLSIIELAIALLLLVITLYMRNWKLPPSSGYFFIFLYFVYVAVQCIAERNNFGATC